MKIPFLKDKRSPAQQRSPYSKEKRQAIHKAELRYKTAIPALEHMEKLLRQNIDTYEKYEYDTKDLDRVLRTFPKLREILNKEINTLLE